MLRAAANDMDLNKRPEWFPAMARLESFAVHARNLLDFYYDDKGIKDDVLAMHFFPTLNVWNDVRPRPPENLADLRERVNKQIAHLTYTRIALPEEQRRWDYIGICEIVEKANRAFADAAPPGVLGESYRARLRGYDVEFDSPRRDGCDAF